MPADETRDDSFEGRLVGDLSGHFVIPGYQRGYRWGPQEVTHLLDDIEASEGSTYYLQPIVVKPLDDDRWELVDGQQRLTTLFLIVQYMQQNAFPSASARYSLEYETRPRSADFLRAPNEAGAAENIDFYHIYRAWTCIKDWFKARGAGETLAAIKLFQAMSERVKVIWYEAPEEISSTDLFTRLNVGKIPLTDAELVKALVLSRSQGLAGRADRAQAIAAEWDVVERDLRNSELWAFLTANVAPEATHISLLLDTIAGGPTGRYRPQFHTFETLRERILTDADFFWNEVIDLHSLVMGWFEDRDLFHKIGYLTATGVAFDEILRLARGARKSEFDQKLDGLIQRGLNLSLDGLRELSYERTSDHKRLSTVLLLMNVETVRQLRHSTERYSFVAHASGRWSLEHIHAQNADELRTVQQWHEWLRLHRNALESLPNLSRAERDSLEERIDVAMTDLSEGVFRELEGELAPHFVIDRGTAADSEMHTIANLALLDGRDNSALNNSWFEVKRLAILQRDRDGSFIPMATRNVFLKYYTGERSQQVQYWSGQDREDYFAAIVREIRPYLRGGTENSVEEIDT